MDSLVLNHVTKKFGDKSVIDNLSLTVKQGEILVLVGPSGCGKSTLLRIIAGLEEPTEGTLTLNGRDITWVEPKKRDVSMVFQNYALYPHMTVFENLMYPLKMMKLTSAERKTKIAEVSSMLNIESFLDRLPATLSGGQKQRVAIGRALVRKPEIFLFDEPLSNLDARLRENLRLEIAALHNALNRTMIYVTHDQHEAMTLGERLAVLKDGKIEQVGTPLELYRNPRTKFVANFLGSPIINMMPVEIDERQNLKPPFDEIKIPSKNALPPGKYFLAIRPEHLRLLPESTDNAENMLPTQIQMIENLGNMSFTHLDYQGFRFIASSPEPMGSKKQDTLIQLPQKHLLLFDEKEQRVL